MIGQCIFPAMLFNIETDFMQNMFIYLHCKKKKGNVTSNFPPQHYLLSLWIFFIAKAQHNVKCNSK